MLIRNIPTNLLLQNKLRKSRRPILKINKVIFLVIITFIFSCSEAPKIEIRPFERIVLAELFTWARCPYCPYAAQALDSLAKEFQDSLVVIAYHRRVGGDTLSPQYVENRKSFYYESGGEPAVFFDGTGPIRTSDPAQNYVTYKSHIINHRNQKSSLYIRLEPQIQNNIGVIRTVIVPTDTIYPANLSLFFIVCEDSVKFFLPGAPDSIFNNVMRVMIPDENGIACTLALNDSLIKTVQLPLNQSWNKNKLTVISFVQNLTNKEILQCTFKKLIQ